MRNKDKVKIIVAVIGLIGIVVTAISHPGNDRNSGSNNNIKSVNNATNDTNNTNNANNTNNLKVIVQVQGKNVELTEEEAQQMANENENLKDDINRYETEIIKYKSDIQEFEDLIDEDVTQAEFKKLGLTINGQERAIDKEKSSILINFQQYFSQEIVENLLPDNTIITIKDDMIYVGKVVKEKKDLLEQPIIDKDFDVFIYDNISDTYGNIYNKALCFQYNGHYIVFNADKAYSRFKCVICMREGYRDESIVQIEINDEVIYTSEKITCQTEPFTVDLPINMASKITIRSMGESGGSGILICEAYLYNEE